MKKHVNKTDEKPPKATFMVRFRSFEQKEAFLQEAKALDLSGNQLAVRRLLGHRRKK